MKSLKIPKKAKKVETPLKNVKPLGNVTAPLAQPTTDVLGKPSKRKKMAMLSKKLVG